MNKEEFLKRLEYLLQGLGEEETVDAISYYRDYFEEAGSENEETVLRELGSPERIAAIIRADLKGDMEGGGEFTDRGYEDGRFRDPGYQVAKRYDLPETKSRQKAEEGHEEPHASASSSAEDTSSADSKPKEPKTNRVLTVILLGVLAVLALPVLLGVGSGLFGIAAAILSLLFTLILGVASVTFALLLFGVVLIVMGFIFLPGTFMVGLLLIGMGLLIFGMGLLGAALSVVFYGQALPAMIRWFVNLIHRLLNGRKGR